MRHLAARAVTRVVCGQAGRALDGACRRDARARRTAAPGPEIRRRAYSIQQLLHTSCLWLRAHAQSAGVPEPRWISRPEQCKAETTRGMATGSRRAWRGGAARGPLRCRFGRRANYSSSSSSPCRGRPSPARNQPLSPVAGPTAPARPLDDVLLSTVYLVKSGCFEICRAVRRQRCRSAAPRRSWRCWASSSGARFDVAAGAIARRPGRRCLLANPTHVHWSDKRKFARGSRDMQSCGR